MKPGKIEKDGLEPELSRHLGPVQAPDELWDRVQALPRWRPVRTWERKTSWGMTWSWAAAALATVAVVAGATVWLNRDLSGEELAVRALNRAPEQLEFRSEDLTEVRSLGASRDRSGCSSAGAYGLRRSS